ncbi:hypothetical protein [Ammoniphilus sp. YIM 78166]|uniref:hypothetical protein n=1 Tax=Ammoniphilus sp. YIM 78166 TaxID=1644106 RepID=UPI00106F23BE|nr:hypothetical protein [Ammoniphilus sp. YIM 78166]
MEDAIMWGPLLVKWKWVVLLVSAGVGYGFIKLRLRGFEQVERATLLDTLSHSVWMSIAIWKFSFILFQPMSVIAYPVTIVYFTGGYKGWILAVISVFFYLLYQSNKQKISMNLYISLLGLGYGGASTVYHGVSWVINDSNPFFYLGEMFLSLLFTWWFFRKESVSQAFDGMIWFGISQIFIHYFKDVHVGMWWGLSRDQLIFLVICLICFIGSGRSRFTRTG